MATTSSAVDLLRGLSAEDIRQRLADLAAEERALKTLLRASIQVERKGKAKPSREGNSHA